MKLIMRRAITDTLRHPMKIKTQIGGVLISLIMIGCIFFMAVKNQPEVNGDFDDFIAYFYNVQGVCFASIVNVTMTNLFGSVMTCK